MKIIETKSATEFLGELQGLLSGGYNKDVVFRGENRCYESVVPTALREVVDGENKDEIGYFADTYLNALGGNIQTPNGTFLRNSEVWDCPDDTPELALHIRGLAQHHGIKTSLLDVSSNPLVAAYFAADYRFAIDDYSDVVRVMAMSPTSSCQLVELPKHGNERLHRQYGAFLRCEKWDSGDRISLLDMQDVDCTCVTMPTQVGQVEGLRLLLRRLGFCPSTMYGDLDAVAAEARWRASVEHWMHAEDDCDTGEP